MLRVRGSQFREENVLRAHDGLSVDNGGAAKTRLPERQIENVVQAERDKRTFAATEEECPEIARSLNYAAECKDTCLNKRPYEIQNNARHDAENHTNNRDKACAAEE